MPSSDFINLNWETEKPTTIKAKMVNLKGEVVKQWSDKVDSTYSKSVQVGELAAGNYYIVLSVEGKQMKKKLILIP